MFFISLKTFVYFSVGWHFSIFVLSNIRGQVRPTPTVIGVWAEVLQKEKSLKSYSKLNKITLWSLFYVFVWSQKTRTDFVSIEMEKAREPQSSHRASHSSQRASQSNQKISGRCEMLYGSQAPGLFPSMFVSLAVQTNIANRICKYFQGTSNLFI